MPNSTVFQGIATLEIDQFLRELTRLKTETRSAVSEIKSAFQEINLGSLPRSTAAAGGSTSSSVASSATRAAREAARREKSEWAAIDEQSKADWQRSQAAEKQRQQSARDQAKQVRQQAAEDAKADRERQREASRREAERARQEKAAQREVTRQQKAAFTAQERARNAQEREVAASARRNARAQQKAEQAKVRQQQIADYRQHQANLAAEKQKALQERKRAGAISGGGGSRGRRTTSGTPPAPSRNSMEMWARQLKYVEDRYNSVFRAGTQIQELGFITGLLSSGLSALGVSLVNSSKEFDSWIRKAYAGAQAAGAVGVSVEKFADVAYRVSQSVGSFDPTQVAEGFYQWQTAMGTVVKTEEDLIATETALQVALMAGSMAKIDAGTAIRGVASVLQEFHMGANRALDVTIKLFNASQISAVEFPELLQSFKMIGPIAASVGMSMEEMLAVLTSLADVGQRGTMAGRGIQQILSSFIKPSKEAATALDSLFSSTFNKSFQEVMFQKDADGIERFIGLIDKADEKGEIHRGLIYYIAEATKTMTEAEKQHFLATITTQNGMRAFMPLLESYERGTDTLNKRFQEFNDTQGQILSFEDAWRTFGASIEVVFGQQLNRIKQTVIELGSAVAIGMAPLVKLLADGAQLVLNWAKANPNLVAGIIAITTAAVALGMALSAVFFFVGQYLQAFAVLRILGTNIGLMVGALGASWLSFGAVLAVVLGLVILFSTGIRSNFANVQQVIQEFSDFFRNLVAGLVQSLDAFVHMVDAMLRGDWEAAWRYAADILSNIGVLIQTAIYNLIPAIINTLSALLDTIGQSIDRFIPGFSNWGRSLMMSFASGIISAAGFVVDSVLSVIGLIAGFLEAHSPPEKGPLRNIDSWGTELMNTYMRGMKKADFKVVNEIADTIEKQLESAMRSGTITPGQYVARNMMARTALTQMANRVRESVENPDKPVTAEERKLLGDQLRSALGTDNEFIRRMLDAYENLAPIEMVIEKEREKLEVLQDQKRELDRQYDVMKQQYDFDNFSQNEEMRQLQLQLDMIRAQNRLEELGLPSTSGTKADKGQRDANRQVRLQNDREEQAIEGRITQIRLELMQKEQEFNEKTAPIRLESARKALEAAKTESEINRNEREAKPYQDKLAAANAALAVQEKALAIAQKAAQLEKSGGGALSGTGDGGKALQEKLDKQLADMDAKAKQWAQEFREKTQKGFDNALVPFTKFSDGVENERKRFQKTLDDWRTGVGDFLGAVRDLLAGKSLNEILTKMITVPPGQASDGQTYVGNRSETANRTLPPWFLRMIGADQVEDNPSIINAKESPRDRAMNRAFGAINQGALLYAGGSLLTNELRMAGAGARLNRLNNAVVRSMLLGMDDAGNGIGLANNGRVTMAGSRLLYEMNNIPSQTLQTALSDMGRYGRLSSSTAYDLSRGGGRSSRILAGMIRTNNGVVDPELLRSILGVRGINGGLMENLIETGEIPRTLGSRLFGGMSGMVNGVRDAYRAEPFVNRIISGPIGQMVAAMARGVGTGAIAAGGLAGRAAPTLGALALTPLALPFMLGGLAGQAASPLVGAALPRLAGAASAVAGLPGAIYNGQWIPRFSETMLEMNTYRGLLDPKTGWMQTTNAGEELGELMKTYPGGQFTSRERMLQLTGVSPRQVVEGLGQRLRAGAQSARTLATAATRNIAKPFNQILDGKWIPAFEDTVLKTSGWRGAVNAETGLVETVNLGQSLPSLMKQFPKGIPIETQTFTQFSPISPRQLAANVGGSVGAAGQRVGRALAPGARVAGRVAVGAARVGGAVGLGVVGGVAGVGYLGARGGMAAARGVGGAARGAGAGIQAVSGPLKYLLGIIKEIVGVNNSINRFFGRLLGLNKLGKAAGPLGNIVGSLVRFIGAVTGFGPLASRFLGIFRFLFKFIPVVGQIMLVIDIIRTLYEVWTTNFAGIRTEIEKATDVIVPAVKDIVKAFEDLFAGRIDFEKFASILGEKFKEISIAVGKALNNIGKNLFDELSKLATNIWGWISTDGARIGGQFLDWLSGLLKKLVVWLAENWPQLVEDIVFWLVRIWTGAAAILYRLGRWAVTEGIPALVGWLKSLVNGAFSDGSDELGKDRSILDFLVDLLKKAISGLYTWITSGKAAEDLTNVFNTFKTLVSRVWSGIMRGWSANFDVEVSGKPTGGNTGTDGSEGKGSRHSGGSVDETGWHFLDKGEYVLSGQMVRGALDAISEFGNLSYQMNYGQLVPAGSMAVGGNVRVEVNLNGNAGDLNPRIKDEITETVIKGINTALKKR